MPTVYPLVCWGWVVLGLDTILGAFQDVVSSRFDVRRSGLPLLRDWLRAF